MVEMLVAATWDGQPVGPEEQVSVRLGPSGEDVRIDVDAPYHGDLPPPRPAGPLWGLWEYEVVEVFVLGADGTYAEIEMGPNGHHLVLRLRGVRDVAERELPMRYEARIGGDRWSAVALLPRAWLPPEPHRANANAIHGVGKGRRYLAWAPVPGDAPDFHRLERFRPIDIPR